MLTGGAPGLHPALREMGRGWRRVRGQAGSTEGLSLEDGAGLCCSESPGSKSRLWVTLGKSRGFSEPVSSLVKWSQKFCLQGLCEDQSQAFTGAEGMVTIKGIQGLSMRLTAPSGSRI